MNLYHYKPAQWAVYLLFFVIVLAFPLLGASPFTLNLFATFTVYAMLALSISVCWGHGGILNLGQGIAFGLGAYGMAMTMQMQSQDPESNPMPPFMLNNSLDHLPWFWQPFFHTGWGIALALAIPTLFSALFGGMMFKARVSGAFVAIMMLAMLSAVYTLFVDLQPYTNGVNGITPPAALTIAGVTIDPYSPLAYWISTGALAIVTLGSKLILESRFGLIMQAIRNDAERVRFLGYSVAFYETVIFTLSGFIAAIAGCVFVMLVQYVSPAQLDVHFSVSIVIWAGIGGRLSLLGAIIGAYLINGAQTYAGDTFLATWLLILGGFFILVVRFLPSGLAGALELVLGYLGGRSGGRGGSRATVAAKALPGT